METYIVIGEKNGKRKIFQVTIPADFEDNMNSSWSKIMQYCSSIGIWMHSAIKSSIEEIEIIN